MSYDPDKHHRRSIRLKGFDYAGAGAYFITINVAVSACGGCDANRRGDRGDPPGRPYDRDIYFGEIVDGVMRLNQFGKIVSEEWWRTAEIRPNVVLDEFVVMPDHIHGIIFIGGMDYVGATRRVARTSDRPASDRPSGPKSGSVGAIVGQFKSVIAKRINQLRNTPGLSIWHRNYYEHIIRDEPELNRIRKYIRNNPLRWSQKNPD